MRALAWVLILSLIIPIGSFAQSTGTPPIFRQEELDQMLAPIALYPDPLLVQMLMAATYPLEVVEATRWVNANPNLKGEQLAIALEQKGWDPSVKSLANFPTALAMMDGNLTWTQNLGDAFLAQKDQVMDTVQHLRARAQAQGNLETTAEQRVTTQDQTILVEPADAQVIYVPAYNPSMAYGPWWYPGYPPYYYNPLGYVIGGLINLGVGLLLGAPWGYAWGCFDWYHHGVYVNPYQNHYYNNYINRDHYAKRWHNDGGGKREWGHDPEHRRNVAYRDQNTRQRYGHAVRPGSDSGKDFRKDSPGIGNRPSAVSDRSGTEDRRIGSGRDRAALDQRNAPADPGHAALYQRKVASWGVRPAMKQRTDISKPVTQPSRPTPVLGGTSGSPSRGGMAGLPFRDESVSSSSYQAGIGGSSYHGANMANHSYRGATAVSPPPRGSGGGSPMRVAGGFSSHSGGSPWISGRHR